MYNADVYNILIASPSDVIEERDAVTDAIYGWNGVHSRDFKTVVLPVKWETHSTPELSGRPQEIINRQIVDTADILIGIFWTRFGSHTGIADSGTVEEIERFRDTGKPVMLYFSSKPVAPESIDSNQYSKVREYKEEIEKEKLGLYGRFTSVDELAEQVKRHLTSKIRELTEHYKTEDHVEPNYNAIPQQDVDVIDELRGALASLSAEWNAERDSGPNSVTEGKNVLQKLKQTLLSFRGALLSLITAERISQLDGFMRDANVMQRHQLFLDGGKSFNQFWELGNDLMDKAQQWAETLNKIEFSFGEVDFKYYGSDNAGGASFTTFDKALYGNCSFRMEILNRSNVKETLKNIRVQVLTVGNRTEKKLKDEQTQRKVAAHYQYDNLSFINLPPREIVAYNVYFRIEPSDFGADKMEKIEKIILLATDSRGREIQRVIV